MPSPVRSYGSPPFRVAVLHGGPGAVGEMAPVARRLSSGCGVLEPFQAAESVDGQVKELRAALSARAATPVTVIGFSWGAWLGCLLAARHPDLVKKLILIGSGPFLEKDAGCILETRLHRLTPGAQAEVRALLGELNRFASENARELLARLCAWFSQADAFDPESEEDASVELCARLHAKVWTQAANLRRSGELLETCRRIRCPVTAIHGDYDPHPAEGVREPLSGIVQNFRFILLKQCGHKPWIERRAQERFYEILSEELKVSEQNR